MKRFTLFTKTYLRHRAVPLVVLAVITGVTVPVLAVGVDIYEISDGSVTEQVSVYQADAQTALEHSSFNIEDYAIVSVVNTGGDRYSVTVKEKYDVTVTADGDTVTCYTGDNLVSTILRQAGIELDENDLVEPSLDTKITESTDIQVTRVTVKQKTETQSIPYSTETRDSNQLYVGDSRVIQEGVDGVQEITMEYTYYDDMEVSSTPVSTRVITEPITKIIENGSKQTSSAPVNSSANTAGSGSSVPAQAATAQTSGSNVISYSKMLTVEATAYSGGGLTASGTSARVGAIAVDPSVIPLGSRLYITSEDGSSWVYGYAVAEDTGGAIKGNRIDLYFDTEAQCYAFGRRPAKVYILA